MVYVSPVTTNLVLLVIKILSLVNLKLLNKLYFVNPNILYPKDK